MLSYFYSSFAASTTLLQNFCQTKSQLLTTKNTGEKDDLNEITGLLGNIIRVMDSSWIQNNNTLFKFSLIGKKKFDVLTRGNFPKTVMDPVTAIYVTSSDDDVTQFPGNASQGNSTKGMYEFYRVS